VILPLLGREIPVIADDFVDPEFGTGMVKVTPAHDPNDFEMGRRHGLEEINVLTPEAVINESGGPYAGLDRYEARNAVVRDLEKMHYIQKVESHLHAVGHCYRCHTVIEPYLSKQWFVSMKELARPAIEAVEEGRTTFVPARWEKTYFEWMYNIRDWCISRQLWFGHRIPAWYCEKCGEVIVSRGDPAACPCGGELEQDPDVLDTWFSSGLWPFSTLGWPDDVPETTYFYPTSVLVTAFDIIFFWVARMMFLGIHFMGDVPFREVFVTALIRDESGKKMSKSSGNVIDPLDVIDRYGADALRFTLDLEQLGPGLANLSINFISTTELIFDPTVVNADQNVYDGLGAFGNDYFTIQTNQFQTIRNADSFVVEGAGDPTLVGPATEEERQSVDIVDWEVTLRRLR